MSKGFNRSPSDVTGSRLVKYGIAPVIKQAFEEVYKAPFIVRILVAELGLKREKDALLTINYDGTFEEVEWLCGLGCHPGCSGQDDVLSQGTNSATLSLEQALDLTLRTWAIGSLAHQQDEADQQAEAKPAASGSGFIGCSNPKQ
jgi:hypothetical protein